MKDLELFKKIWRSRNPFHDRDQEGTDRFWATAELVAREYVEITEAKKALSDNKHLKCKGALRLMYEAAMKADAEGELQESFDGTLLDMVKSILDEEIEDDFVPDFQD